MSPSSELTSSHHHCNGRSFIYRCMSWADKVCHHHPGEAYSESQWEWESTRVPAQHQTGETPLRWVNRKLHTFLRMFSGASLPDPGWRVWCRGKGICGHQHQLSGCRGTDHTNEVTKMQPIMISSIPHLFILESVTSKWRVQNGHISPCIDLWDDHSILNTDAKKLLAFPMLGTSTVITLPQWDERSCSTS